MEVNWRTRDRQTGWNVVVAVALLWLGLYHSRLAAETERHLRVVYQPPHLSVQAQEIGLPEVLRAIGAKVGFAVIDSGGSRAARTVSIEATALGEVLRQLLRAENHAIVYRGQGGEIDTIVLLGPRSYAEAAPESADQRQEQKRHDSIRGSYSAPIQSLESSPIAQSMTPLSPEGGRGREEVAEEGDIAITVEEILRLHAIPGLRELTGMMPGETVSAHVDQPWASAARRADEDPPDGSSANPLAMGIDETLAITTRRAQQHLKALIDGLATATSSWLDSPADARR